MATIKRFFRNIVLLKSQVHALVHYTLLPISKQQIRVEWSIQDGAHGMGNLLHMKYTKWNVIYRME